MRGVTLIELVMVMVLLMILAGVVAPRFTDSIPALRVQSATDQTYAGLHKARNDAAIYGLRTRFAVHKENRTWRVTIELRPLKQPDVFTSIDMSWDTTTFPEGVEAATLDGFKQDSDTGEYYLEFRGDGTAEQDATITLKNEEGDERTLKVTGTTGRIAFVEAVSE